MKSRFRRLWNDLPLERKGQVMIAVPLLALILMLSLSLYTKRIQEQADTWLRLTSEARLELNEYVRLIVDAETAVRGYALTGNNTFLRPYEEATRQLATRTGSHLLRIEEPFYRGQLATLHDRVARRMALLERLKEAISRNDANPRSEQTAALLDNGRVAMDEVRQSAREVDHALWQMSQRRLLESERVRAQSYAAGWVSILVGTLGGLLLVRFFSQNVTRRIQRLVENVKRVARNQEPIPVNPSKDEIGVLAHHGQVAAGLLRRREHELRQSEQRFRTLFDHAPVAYFEVDRDGRIQRMNREALALLGRSDEQTRDVTCWSMAAPAHRPQAQAIIEARLAGTGNWDRFQCEMLRGDGGLRTVEVYQTPLHNDDGSINGMQTALIDLTERIHGERLRTELSDALTARNAELTEAFERLKLVSEHKSRFLANMSHELRTPLNGIIGFSEVLHDGKAGPLNDLQQEFLADVLTNARHLLALINDILDLASVEAGRISLQPEEFDGAVAAQEVLDAMRTLAEGKQITLNRDLTTAIPVFLDRRKFKQALFNYLSNAVKFTPPHGEVTLRIEPEGSGWIRISVRDSGPGISPEDLDRLFQEFEQLDNSSAKTHQGTGLGLALTKGIVEAQGGQVGVSSQPGHGSEFWALLPSICASGEAGVRTCIIARKPGELMRTLREQGLRTPSPQRVLVIDNDPSVLKLTSLALAEGGYEGILCQSPQEGLAALEQGSLAAVVLDLSMPGMEGFEFLEVVRNSEGRPSIIVWTDADLSSERRLRLEGLTDEIFRKTNRSVRDVIAEIARNLNTRPAIQPESVVGSDKELHER